ncbi:YggT family protein [Anaerolineales bacterium HSG24]|nr:YggT family protein [Anaerolineales bacterium HSG24]
MSDFLALAIILVFDALWWAIIIRVLMSWLPMANIRIDPYHPVVQFLYSITNPIMEPLRPYFTIDMIDLSPIVALIGLEVIKAILLMLLGARSF